MKALVKRKAEPGIWMEEVEVPKIGPKEVLLKVIKASICGTDVHIYNWDDWSKRTIKPPLTIGHEFVGRIVECGKEVKHYSIGERVSVEGHIVCGECRACQAGRKHLCPNTIGIGVQRNGGFAEYVAVPETNLWRVHTSIPDEIASIYDPLGNATHAALSFDLIGEDVLITGAGPIGCMAAAICRHSGARNVVITDLNKYRLGLALTMGADRVLDVTHEDLGDAMKSLGIMSGFDIGLEMSGNGLALRQMLDNMYHGGRVALLGLIPKNTAIDWDKVIFKGLQIKGIYGREIFETWYKLEAMLRSHLDISSIITHRFDFDDFAQGFEVMASGNSGKVILNVS